MMDQQILGMQDDFQMTVQNSNVDPQQKQFNQVVMSLQQVILDDQFQYAQTQFMRVNCDIEVKTPSELEQLFNLYKTQIGQLLNQKISQIIPNFNLIAFANEVKNRNGQIDQQIAEILLSFIDLQSFKTMLNDYKAAQQEQQRYRVLTVKTNKLPENKKIKGNSQNIFGCSNTPSFGTKTSSKKTNNKTIQKTLEQLLVPETVLTVKGLRKC